MRKIASSRDKVVAIVFSALKSARLNLYFFSCKYYWKQLRPLAITQVDVTTHGSLNQAELLLNWKNRFVRSILGLFEWTLTNNVKVLRCLNSVPLGNALDTELKHKQNYFARRIKHNSQTDEKREMLTIYNACGAEKKTVWRHTALLPSGNLNYRLFDSSGDAVSITFKELVGHILSSYVTRDLYAVTSIVDYCISTEMFSIKTSPSKQRFPCYKVGFCAYVQFHYSCAELKPPNLFPWKIWIMWTWIWWHRLSLLIFILWTGSPILSNVWTNMLGSL